MVTRAQLDAALSNLENRLRKEINLKYEARTAEAEMELKREDVRSEEKREIIEDEIYQETGKEIEKMKEECGRNHREIDRLKQQLVELEKSFDRFRSQHGAEDIVEEELKGDY